MNKNKFPINSNQRTQLYQYLFEWKKIVLSEKSNISRWWNEVESFLNVIHNGKTLNPWTNSEQSPYELFIACRTWDWEKYLYDEDFLSKWVGVVNSLISRHSYDEGNYNFISEDIIESLNQVLESEWFKDCNWALNNLCLLIEELNFSWKNKKKYSSIFLQRAIIDLIPKILWLGNFDALISEYNWRNHLSFKKVLEKLNSVTKSIADIHLHWWSYWEVTINQINNTDSFDLLFKGIIERLNK